MRKESTATRRASVPDRYAAGTVRRLARRLLAGAALVLACVRLSMAAPPAKAPRSAPSPDREMRCVWLEWVEADASKPALAAKLDAFKRVNFNSVLVPFHYIGYVSYPNSAYLPQNPRHAKHGDIVGWLVEEIHKRGMRAELFAEYGFTAWRCAPAERSVGPILDKYPELAQVDTSGTKSRYNPVTRYQYCHICPSNPRSADILARLYAEAARKYPADSFVLGSLWYQSEKHCFCSYCREEFRKDTGMDLAPFEKNSPGAEAFARWKQERIADAVAAIARKIRQARPGMPILCDGGSLADRDPKGLAWEAWLQQGSVDKVLVRVWGDIRKQLAAAVALANHDASRLVCVLSCDGAPAKLVSNIGQTRKAGTAGYVANPSRKLLPPHYNALVEGPQASPAVSSLGPAQSVSNEADAPQ